LTASEDGTARVWDAETGDNLLTLSGHEAGVNQALWNEDASRILTASYDGIARQYYTCLEDLLDSACQRLDHNLTQAEWDQFLPDEDYRQTCPNLPVPKE